MMRFFKIGEARWRLRKLARSRWWIQTLFATLAVIGLGVESAAARVTLDLGSAPSGVALGGIDPSYTAGFGNVNGLGAGSPAAGVTLITTGVVGGVIYSTPYNIVLSRMPASHSATVSAYVSANFVQPTILILESCYPSSGCVIGGSFTTISTSALTPTPIIASPGAGNGTYTASLGLFVANTDGPGVSSGADSATLTLVATDTTNGRQSTVNLTLNSPSENLQTAVEFLLSTAPGGLTISPASDFSVNYGNVNGLGLAPGAGLSVVASAGGVVYSTPYLFQPSFSSFTSTTCSVSVYVSMDFVHPAILQLQDSGVLPGPYTSISKISGAPTPIAAAASSGSSSTRYLGLFVSNANGPGAFTGSDSATLTYTMTVP